MAFATMAFMLLSLLSAPVAAAPAFVALFLSTYIVVAPALNAAQALPARR